MNSRFVCLPKKIPNILKHLIEVFVLSLGTLFALLKQWTLSVRISELLFYVIFQTFKPSVDIIPCFFLISNILNLQFCFCFFSSIIIDSRKCSITLSKPLNSNNYNFYILWTPSNSRKLFFTRKNGNPCTHYDCFDGSETEKW